MQRAAQGRVGVGGADGGKQGGEVAVQRLVDAALQAQADALALRPVEELAVQHLGHRPYQPAPAHHVAAPSRPQSPDRGAVPVQAVRVVEHDGLVADGLQAADAARHLLAQRAAGSALHEALLGALHERVGQEHEAADVADRVALDDDLAARGNGGQQLGGVWVVEPAHQHGRAAVDEARGQLLVQGV